TDHARGPGLRPPDDAAPPGHPDFIAESDCRQQHSRQSLLYRDPAKLGSGEISQFQRRRAIPFPAVAVFRALVPALALARNEPSPVTCLTRIAICRYRVSWGL